ncbi:hypothetical protein [uncultured Oscillibacter sp.]|uniref:hypothetical protein n=1 Tax=uncultured Oscillibacter sp. TaxID=876091 RepID=UPI0025EC8591|nr:hypothetical protein [uncultured Oscillibacter sp.]
MNLRIPKDYIEHCLMIRDKKNQLVPLILKPAQRRLYEAIKREHEAGRPVRLLILKARQLGFSTLVEAMMYQDSATRKLVRTMIVAHRDDSTAGLFRMNKLFFDSSPPAVKPMRKANNAQELVFENPTKNAAEKEANPGLMSSIRCVTAGAGGIGRSETLTNLHASEFAFWPGDPEATLLGLMQAIPDDPNTMAVIESTPNGYNYFKTLWDGAEKGENGWVPFFSPWFEEPEYRKPVPPETVWTGEETELAAAYHLDEEQLMWRRWCIKTNCGGNVELFRQEYPSCAEEAFLFSGTPFFDNQKLILRLEDTPKPIKVGRFTYAEPKEENGKPENGKWHTDKRGGYIRLWELPKEGVPYVMGCDTAGDGSDRFIAWVIDNTTGEQVAELRFTHNAILFTRQIWCLGHYYNAALIAVETNYNSYVSMTLELWNYPKLYIRERSMDSYTHKLAKKYGFATTSQTRPVILDNLQTIIDEHPEWVKSEEALREMTHFVYNEKRRPEAESGEHDDYVMAMAITYFCREQQSRVVKLPPAQKAEWTEDMYEDYRNADAAGKRYLLKKWGNPF